MSIGLQIFLALGGSALISTVVSFIFGRLLTRAADKHDKERSEIEELHRTQARQERINDIKELLVPVGNKIDKLEVKFDTKIEEIGKKLDLNTEANVTKLRDAMKDRRDRLLERGWASASDRAAWQDLYNVYANLGGNHFREYVNQWQHDVMNLPENPPEN